MKFPVLLFLWTRLAYVGISWMGLTILPGLIYHDADRHRALQPYPWIDGLCRWDCGWFHNVVVNGYATPEYAKVFPLFAVLGGGIERLTGLNHLVAFIIVANICALAAYIVIYRLFTELEDEQSARFGLLALTAFPFAYYTAAGYAESIMMLTTAGAIVLARRGHHLRAGVVLTLGFAARHLSLAAGAGLGLAQLRQHLKQRHTSAMGHDSHLLRGALGLMLPWVFLYGFGAYLQEKVGDSWAWWSARNIGWKDEVWWGAWQILTKASYADRPEYFWYLLFAIPVLAGGVGLALAWRRYGEVSAFGLVLLAVVMFTGAAGMGRYLGSIWPCFLPLGAWLAKRPAWQGPVLGCFWLFQGLWFFLFTHQWRVL